MNRIIKQASVIGLFVLAVAIGVNAQAGQQYRAEIPFSFEVAGKHFEAGKYSVGPLSQVTSPGGIAIRKVQNGESQLLGVTSLPGDNNWDKPGKLTFLRVDGVYRLSRISTATFGMKIRIKSGEMAQAGKAHTPEIVAIDLYR